MSCCGILCSCNDISLCVDCEFYEYAILVVSCFLDYLPHDTSHYIDDINIDLSYYSFLYPYT